MQMKSCAIRVRVVKVVKVISGLKLKKFPEYWK